MLHWTCKEIIAQRALEGKEQVSLGELDLSRLPDEVIDTDISSLRKYKSLGNTSYKAVSY